jgi:RHS repeat-associated protein
VFRLTSLSQPCAGCGGGSSVQSRNYDANGYPNVVTDFGGTTTDHDYDALGREFQRIEAATVAGGGSPPERRTIETTGSTCPILGLVKTVDGPRTDVADVTTYSYHATTDESGCDTGGACRRKGDLAVVTNALGHTTEYLRYDRSGRVAQTRDASGVVTDLEYHARGWLVARKVRGPDAGSETDDAITRIDYDAVGQVTRVTQPDGGFVAYTYDDAHRLTDITDNAGNTIHYTLDAAGNRIKEETKDPAGAVQRLLARQYDQLSRLKALVNAPYAAQPNLDDPSVKKTVTTYDPNGNADTVTDPLANVADNDYDPLNRLIRTIQDVGGINATTQFAHDARDNLVSVTDPKGLVTQYVYDGLNNLDQLISPDTGTTDYGHDAAGNRLTQTDARGVTASYSYDALNRLTLVAYPNAALNTTFQYDLVPADCQTGETFGIGRLGRMTDASGETRYCHDRRGNVVRKVQVTNGVTFVLRYAYDLADRPTTLVYPSGATVSLGRDAQGRVASVSHQAAGAGSATTVVSAVSWHPFGPARTLSYGNGRTLTRQFDQNYGIDHVNGAGTGGLRLEFTLDDAGNLSAGGTTIGGGGVSRRWRYDDLYRLLGADNSSNVPQEAWSYDATGNRLSKLRSGTSSTYAYAPTSHRLASVDATARGYDAAGNTTAVGTAAYEYDERNRLVGYRSSGTLQKQYRYNGRGERVGKYKGTTASQIVYYAYDEAGRLLGEYDSAGVLKREHVWLDDLPVASFDPANGLAYVEADHLGTPRVLVDPVRDVAIWRRDFFNSAFGENTPTQNPDGDTITTVYNLRFPGQYYDAETKLHYNYFRDYEPGTGRYIESDPIGIWGGLATYAYVRSDPLGSIDPTGLARVCGQCAGLDCLLYQSNMSGSGRCPDPVSPAPPTSCDGNWEFLREAPHPLLPLLSCRCFWVCIKCDGTSAGVTHTEGTPVGSAGVSAGRRGRRGGVAPRPQPRPEPSDCACQMPSGGSKACSCPVQ